MIRPKLIGALLACSLIGTTISEGKKYHRVVPMGEDFLRGNDSMCGGMSASLTSGEFFEGLKSHRTKDGIEFRRNLQTFQTFPDELTLTVRTITGPCTGPGDPHQKSENLERFDAVFIKSLKFECFWKEGFEMTKADIPVFNEVEPRLPDSLPVGAAAWNYELKVKSAGVSLAKALVLNVLSGKGKVIARFSASL